MIFSLTSSSAPAILRILRVLSFKTVSFDCAHLLSLFFKLGQHQLIDVAPPQAGHKAITLLRARWRTGLAGTFSPLG